jgi:HAMP domain-containing protein
MAAQSNNDERKLVLPNPTPRPPDLKKIYEEDPAEKARQQQSAMLRAAQQREQVKSATSRLAELAQQLKDDMEKHEPGGPLGPDAQKAAEIEKLAKTVKNTMKSQ